MISFVADDVVLVFWKFYASIMVMPSRMRVLETKGFELFKLLGSWGGWLSLPLLLS